uniref:MADS-box domain-containing protein n=1 Tax=Brugia timori TaxID=42155 RepID=A0A0R3QFW7_9BILA
MKEDDGEDADRRRKVVRQFVFSKKHNRHTKYDVTRDVIRRSSIFILHHSFLVLSKLSLSRAFVYMYTCVCACTTRSRVYVYVCVCVCLSVCLRLVCVFQFVAVFSLFKLKIIVSSNICLSR